MNTRCLTSFSLQMRTNIMFLFTLVIFSCLQNYIFCVSLQPKLTEKAILTSDQIFFTCSRDENEKEGILQWINPYGVEVDTNSDGGVYVMRSGNKDSGLKLFFIKTSKRDSGDYKCQLVKDNRVLSETSFKLSVYKAIDVSGNKLAYIGVEGDVLNIVCLAKFDPNIAESDAQINWWFNNNMITSGDGQFTTRINKNPTQDWLSIKNQLNIKNLSKENEGVFTCRPVASTIQLSLIENVEISVRVQFRPNFPPNTRKFVWISDSLSDSPLQVNVTCIVNADPVASFKWLTGDGIPVLNGMLRDKSKVTGLENMSVLSLDYRSLQEIRDDNNDQFGNMRKFICQASNQLGEAQMIYELKVGQLPETPVIVNHSYNNGLFSFTLNESEVSPPVETYRIEIADKQFVYFNTSNKNPINNTYDIQLDIPQGQHKMIIYARNPVGWSQQPTDGYYYLAVISSALIAQQYMAFVIISLTIALANAL